MFRKVMQISDDLMCRYYELLTDMQASELTRLRDEIAAGRRDPMQVKMELGRRIVADFHSSQDADAAIEAFDREVRQGLEPADIETVDLPQQAHTSNGIQVHKLLALIGLADSVNDATRKIKAGAVEIDGQIYKELNLQPASGVLVLRVGKKWKRVKVSP